MEIKAKGGGQEKARLIEFGCAAAEFNQSCFLFRFSPLRRLFSSRTLSNRAMAARRCPASELKQGGACFSLRILFLKSSKTKKEKRSVLFLFSSPPSPSLYLLSLPAPLSLLSLLPPPSLSLPSTTIRNQLASFSHTDKTRKSTPKKVDKKRKKLTSLSFSLSKSNSSINQKINSSRSYPRSRR